MKLYILADDRKERLPKFDIEWTRYTYLDVEQTIEIENELYTLVYRLGGNNYISGIEINLYSQGTSNIRVRSSLGIASLTVSTSIKNQSKAISSLIDRLKNGPLEKYIAKNKLIDDAKNKGYKTFSSQAVFKQMIKKNLKYSPWWSYSDTGKTIYSRSECNVNRLEAFVEQLKTQFPDMNISGSHGYYYVKGPKYSYDASTDTYTPLL